MKLFRPEYVRVTLQLPGGHRIVVIDSEGLAPGSKERNLYRIDQHGEVIWQVEDYGPTFSRSTFTNVYFDDKGRLRAYNFDGGEYEIDPQDRSIRGSRLLK
jgi:hypothetical protein